MLFAHGRCAMTGHCCARQYSAVSGSILPAVLLLVLPKCPLCLAAWLTPASGVSFTATGAAWLRLGTVLLWIAIVMPMLWRRVFKRASSVQSCR